eukprot:1605230-Alexandrium_andersonii.AAC.1
MATTAFQVKFSDCVQVSSPLPITQFGGSLSSAWRSHLSGQVAIFPSYGKAKALPPFAKTVAA